MSFVLSIFCVSACVGSIAFAKSRPEKIDGGYRFTTYNSSEPDKSISDTNSTTGSYTFLGFLCFTPDEIYDVICVYPCVGAEREGGGVGGSPFGSRGGLTVQDWTIFIYNRAEENRFVPDDIFIDWNMYYPPFYWKWLISGLAVAALFLESRGAVSQPHNMLDLIPTWIFQCWSGLSWKDVKGNKKTQISPVCNSFMKWPTGDEG